MHNCVFYVEYNVFYIRTYGTVYEILLYVHYVEYADKRSVHRSQIQYLFALLLFAGTVRTYVRSLDYGGMPP